MAPVNTNCNYDLLLAPWWNETTWFGIAPDSNNQSLQRGWTLSLKTPSIYVRMKQARIAINDIPSEVREALHLKQPRLVEGTGVHVNTVAICCQPVRQDFIILRRGGKKNQWWLHNNKYRYSGKLRHLANFRISNSEKANNTALSLPAHADWKQKEWIVIDVLAHLGRFL